jgi:DNA-binding NarL/FixJ family response regulator
VISRSKAFRIYPRRRSTASMGPVFTRAGMTSERSDAERADSGSGVLSEAPVRIVVVDDHALVREGTVVILERDPMLSVVGQAADGVEAVELICELRPDLAVVDIELPGLNGIEVVRAVHRRVPGIRFLVVSAYDDHAYLIEALAAGVAGYLLKTVSGRELVQAVRAAAGGSVVFDEGVSRRLTGTTVGGAPEAPVDLTPRETDVLAGMARGLSNRQIAVELGLGLRTVESHVSNVLSKLGSTSRTQAVLYTIRHHLVPSAAPAAEAAPPR